MSDFLTSLAATTLHLTTLIEPRVPSHFENAAEPGPEPSFEEPPTGDPRSQHPAALTSSYSSEGRRDREPRATWDHGQSQPTSTFAPAIHNEPEFEREHISLLPPPPAVAAAHEPKSERSPETPPSDAKPAIGSAAPAVSSTVTPPQPIARKTDDAVAAAVPVPSEPPPPSRRTAIARERIVESQRVVRELHVLSNEMDTEPPAIAVLRPATLPAPTAAPRRHRQPTTTATIPLPERNVHVTIGRIEVRAASPSRAGRAVPRATSTPPGSNLEQYLRRRSGKTSR